MIFMMGNRLREILNKEGITAYRVCKDLGIDQGEMSRFLNGKVNLTLSRLEMVADHLGYDLVLVKRKAPRKGVKK
jgi:transcriptional regulator with XRE-family HTH domain